MTFSKFKYAWRTSNIDHEDFTKAAVMIILNQIKFWWTSETVTQHSHLTLIPLCYKRLWGCTVMGSEKWYSKELGGKRIKPIFSQTRFVTWLSIYWNWHKYESKDVAWFKLWKSLNYTLGHSYYYGVVSIPSFMPALGLLRSFTTSNSLIQQWVVLKWVPELNWLGHGSSARAGRKEMMGTQ